MRRGLDRYMADKIKANVYFDGDMLQGLKKLAALKGVPYASLVREACREYVLRHATQIIDDSRTLERVHHQ